MGSTSVSLSTNSVPAEFTIISVDPVASDTVFAAVTTSPGARARMLVVAPESINPNGRPSAGLARSTLTACLGAGPDFGAALLGCMARKAAVASFKSSLWEGPSSIVFLTVGPSEPCCPEAPFLLPFPLAFPPLSEAEPPAFPESGLEDALGHSRPQ